MKELNGNRFQRSKFLKSESEIDHQINVLVRGILLRYPNLDIAKRCREGLDLEEACAWMQNHPVPIAAFLIAYYVNRDSSVTMNKIATYCADGNLSLEWFLHRAVNEFVDSRYKISALTMERDELKAQLARTRRPFWKRWTAWLARLIGR